MDLPEPIHRVRLENAGPFVSQASSPVSPKVQKRKSNDREPAEDLRADTALEKQVKEEAERAGKDNLLFEETPLE